MSCEKHKNFKTSVPVCVVCLYDELDNLRKLATDFVSAIDREAKALSAYEIAVMDYTESCKELSAYQNAIIDVSKADSALRSAIKNDIGGM